jgi:glycosyltransferase involved in cell wall biosynthesis
MRILHTVEFYAPSIGGMQEVVRQLSERLAKKGHSVTVATSKIPERQSSTLNGVEIAEFKISGSFVKGIEGEVSVYEKFLLENRFDVVVNFAAQQWATDLALPCLVALPGRKVFVPTGFPALGAPDYREYFQAMKDWIKGYDANIFLSPHYRDIDFARENGAKRVTVIPNGAGKDEFLAPVKVDIRAKLGIPPGHRLVLHVGSHTGLKGHGEVYEIFRRARLANATLLLVANDQNGSCRRRCMRRQSKFKWSPLRCFDHKQFLVRELSREDTLAAYHEADLFLFPSWIECSPLVIFEALASKTPFLSSNVGNVAEVVEASGGGELMVSEVAWDGFVHVDVEDAAIQLSQLMEDQSKRAEMAENGYEAWLDRHTWEAIAERYEALYEGLVGLPG